MQVVNFFLNNKKVAALLKCCGMIKGFRLQKIYNLQKLPRYAFVSLTTQQYYTKGA